MKVICVPKDTGLSLYVSFTVLNPRFIWRLLLSNDLRFVPRMTDHAFLFTPSRNQWKWPCPKLSFLTWLGQYAPGAHGWRNKSCQKISTNWQEAALLLLGAGWLFAMAVLGAVGYLAPSSCFIAQPGLSPVLRSKTGSSYWQKLKGMGLGAKSFQWDRLSRLLSCLLCLLSLIYDR